MVAALGLTACSSVKQVEPKPDVPVETVAPAPQPQPEPAPPTTTPIPERQPQLEELVKLYGEPVKLRADGSGKYVLVKVAYDNNGNLNADTDEPILQNWGVDSTHFDTYKTNAPITTGASGGVLLELPKNLENHGFMPTTPRATDPLAVWHGQTQLLKPLLSTLQSEVPIVSLTVACRTAETSDVVPISENQEMREWRCEPTTQMPNVVHATWQQIGEGIQASGGGSNGTLRAFSVSKNPKGIISVAIENFRYDFHFSETTFLTWKNNQWLESAIRAGGVYNDLGREVQMDSVGRFLVTRYTGNMSTNQSYGISRWESDHWSVPIPLSDSNQNNTFFLDLNDQIHRLRYLPTSEQSIAERWDGSDWVQIGEPFGYLRDVGRSLHFAQDNEVFAISSGGYGPWYWTNIRKLNGTQWDQSLEAPDFPKRKARHCSDLHISHSKKLLFKCRVDLYANAKETPNNTLLTTTLSLLENDHWSTLSFGPGFDATAFDSSERPIKTTIEDGNLYVLRWNGARWETLGNSLNVANGTVATGQTMIATGPNCSVYVAWMGEKDGTRHVYVSQLHE